MDVEAGSVGEPAGQLAARWVHHPLGLMSLAAAARRAMPEIEFRILHTAVSRDPRGDLVRILRDEPPDLVGFRALSVARAALESLARLVRETAPGLPVLAGGPHPSASPGELLERGWVDLVVVGEGEETFVEVLRRFRAEAALPRDLAGTAVIVDGRVHLLPTRPPVSDLDGLPFPDYGLVDPAAYRGLSHHAFQSAGDAAFVAASRGCPYRCFYCHQLFGKRIRRRSAGSVEAEIREHVERRGLRNFVFVDDVFNVPMEAGKEVLRRLARAFGGSIRLYFPNGLRADQVDEEMLGLFEEAGTVQMALAVETASPRLQKLVGKNLDVERARRMIDAASRRFVVCAFFMAGFPGETMEEARSTVAMAAGLDHVVQPVLSIVRVYPGTSLYEWLDPSAEEARRLREQETEMLQPGLFGVPVFYGDVLPPSKVPLRGEDIRRLRWEWMKSVVNNPARLAQGHGVLRKHLDRAAALEFYRNFLDDASFDEAAYERLFPGDAPRS